VKLISEIEIEGFRSIRSTILSGLNDFTTLAGLNNSGKSNALRALNSFFNSQTDLGTEIDVDADGAHMCSKENAFRSEQVPGAQRDG